jgi:hypothetical protein
MKNPSVWSLIGCAVEFAGTDEAAGHDLEEESSAA